MASLFERQRADVESRLDAIVRGAEPVTSRALVSLQGALGLDDVILDDEGVPRDAPGSETRALVEHALCRLTQRVMQEQTEGGGAVRQSRVDDADDDDERSGPSSIGSLLDRCLDLALALSESGVADPGSVFVAAEQVFEASTVETCARVFSWVERARERLSDDTLWKRGKLTVLRVCNDLARRLSKEKTSDVVLRGRVSLLLSALYPLSERSALNIAGAYNNDEKRYDVERPSSDEIPRVSNAATEVSERRGYAKNESKNVEGNASADVDALLSSAVDAAFYRTFWNLQIFFRDPQSTLAAGPGGWNAFRRSLEAVLAAFETHQLDRSAAAEAEAAAAAAAFAAGGGVGRAPEPRGGDRRRAGGRFHGRGRREGCRNASDEEGSETRFLHYSIRFRGLLGVRGGDVPDGGAASASTASRRRVSTTLPDAVRGVPQPPRRHRAGAGFVRGRFEFRP
jgi:hypothetical protein